MRNICIFATTYSQEPMWTNVYTKKNEKRNCRKNPLEGLLCVLSCILFLSSCSEQYNISGDSSVTTLDGRMLYLKVANDNNMRNLDSCEVVHGKFNFMGMVDSTVMGEIYMDNEGMMPIVVENGNVSIMINNTEQKVVGGPLNNRLYCFLEAKSRIEDEIMNLSNEEAEMILAGVDPRKAHLKLAKQTNQLYNELETLETKFISTNSNNILGFNFFMMLCSQYPYPIMTPQIEKIVKGASKTFRNQAFVQNYLQAAKANMKLLENQKRDQIQQARNDHP